MIFIHSSPAFHSTFHPCAVDPATRTTNFGPCSRKANTSNKKACCGGGDANKMNMKMASRFVVEKTPLHRDETSEKTSLSLDVAGFQLGQLTIEIDDHVLTISGERTNKLGDTFVTQRRFALQRGIYDEDNVSATLEDGVLEVTIAKKPLQQRRKIPITVTSSFASAPVPVLENNASSSLSDEGVKEQNPTLGGSPDTPPSPVAGTETTHDEVLSVETVQDEEEGENQKNDGRADEEGENHKDAVDGNMGASTPVNEESGSAPVSEESADDSNTPDSTWENIVETFFHPEPARL